MGIKKGLLPFIGAFFLLLVVSTSASAHTIGSNYPSGEWRYSGYHPVLRTYVLPYAYSSSLSSYSTNYPDITNQAKNEWNNRIDEVYLSRGTSKNLIAATNSSFVEYDAYYQRINTSGEHVSRWKIIFNDYRMKHHSRANKVAIAIHEFGHLLGLGHYNSPYAIMRPDPTSSLVKSPSIDEIWAVDWINENPY